MKKMYVKGDIYHQINLLSCNLHQNQQFNNFFYHFSFILHFISILDLSSSIITRKMFSPLRCVEGGVIFFTHSLNVSVKVSTVRVKGA